MKDSCGTLMHYLKRVFKFLFPFRGFLLYLKYRFLSFGASNKRFHSIYTKSCHPGLIFVSGPPRSGTTMLQSALMRHPDICGFSNETNIFSRTNPYRADFSPLSFQKVKSVLNTSSSMAAAYMRLASDLCTQKSSLFVSEKTPQHCFHALEIARCFPTAKFIFIIRNPYSCVSSMMNHSAFIPQGGSVLRSIMYWINSIISIQKFSSIHPNNSLILRYENVCNSPTYFSGLVCNFLGVAQCDFFSIQNVDTSSELHSFSGKPGFMGINMPPSADLSNSSMLDDFCSSLIKTKLSEFSICYEQI